MNQERFEEGRRAYAAKDYRAAAKAFLEAASRSEGSGASYHMAGNSFVRLRRFVDAVTVYRHALADESYTKHAAVQCNLAAARVALGEYAEAIHAYDAALEDSEYEGQYRALQGKAGALFEMGRIEEAALAYRQAALDGDNPDPGKALNNLGLCLMRLDRATDAVEAYRAALGFDNYTSRGRVLSNLGIAYHAIGCYADAVKAFEKATEMHGYDLPPQGREAYLASQNQLRDLGQREVIEGWSTGEMSPVSQDAPVGVPPVSGDPFEDARAAMRSAGEEGAENDEVSAFYALSDEQIRDQARSSRDKQHAQRGPWVLVGTAVLVLALIVGAAMAAFFTGLGYPTQSMTVSGMLDAHAEGQPVTSHWVAVPPADIDQEMAKIPPIREYVIDSVDRGSRTSRVGVTVTPENGAPLQYQITLAREGVGWRVTGVENDWRSTGGGS